MQPKSRIHIVSGHPPEFNSNVTFDGLTYHVQTEDMGSAAHKVVSSVFLEGEVVFSKESDYAELAGQEDFGERLRSLMQAQHALVFEEFLSARKQQHIESAKKLLRRGGGLSALNALREALKKFPDDPLLQSFYGFLVTSVEKKPEEGIKTCRRAIEALKGSGGDGQVLAECYLNLGKAYIRCQNRPEAINALSQGLKAAPGHRDLLWEMKKLGTRRKPPLPFLKRGNPINKYLGLFASRLKRA
jgi:tetratricopeptide (TPR) repeat protein